MPLSDEEQRILGEIERQLRVSDQGLAHELSNTTVYSRAFRTMKLATVAFVAGVAVMLATLQISYLLAFVGFLIMLASALVFERNARRLGRTGFEQVTRNIRPQSSAQESSERCDLGDTEVDPSEEDGQSL